MASHDVPVNTGGSWPHAATSSFDVPCVETVTDDASSDVTFQKIFAAVKCQHAAEHANHFASSHCFTQNVVQMKIHKTSF
jgi:hypothetical protein